MTYRIQEATLADLSPLDVHALYKLRVDVFVHEQQVPYAEIDDVDAAASTTQFLLWEDSPAVDNADGKAATRLAGTLRLFPSSLPLPPVVSGTTTVSASEAVTQLGRFCFAPDYRGTGAAAYLLEHAIERCREQHPDRALYLTAQAPLVAYYEKFGFAPHGELFDDEGQPHQPMILRPARAE